MKRSYLQLLGGLALLLGALLLMPAGRAAAHAAYDHSTPAKDEVVPTEPAQVDAYFKQVIFSVRGVDYLRVFNDDNTTQVSPGDGTVDDVNRKHMFTALPAGLPNGRYIVHWATQSDADGDKDSGMYCFYIGVQPTTAQQAQCASFAPTPVPTLSGTATHPPSTTATSTALPRLSDGFNPRPGGSSSTGLIIGVVAGVIVAVVVVGGAGLWWRSRRA